MAILERLQLFCDERARDGAGQMAMDQTLLETATGPVLRVYKWAGAAVSFGYAQSLREVTHSFPHSFLVRRWTGGGMVEHGRDWTFGLVCPAGEGLAGVQPGQTYRLIHLAVIEGLKWEEVEAKLVAQEEALAGANCFVAPALHDVFDEKGVKICGGAQRRTRLGFLHQGSLQMRVSEGFAQRFAASLAGAVVPFLPSAELEKRAEELVSSRYGTRTWLEKIS